MPTDHAAVLSDVHIGNDANTCWYTDGTSDLVLTGHAATYGSYVVGPPSWIPRGTLARLVLQDPKPSWHGSQGSVTYDYCDANLTMRTVMFSFECPTGFYDNKAASSQAGWACFAKSRDPNHAWSSSVPGGGHPLFVGSVTGGGQPRWRRASASSDARPSDAAAMTQSRRLSIPRVGVRRTALRTG